MRWPTAGDIYLVGTKRLDGFKQPNRTAFASKRDGSPYSTVVHLCTGHSNARSAPCRSVKGEYAAGRHGISKTKLLHHVADRRSLKVLSASSQIVLRPISTAPCLRLSDRTDLDLPGKHLTPGSVCHPALRNCRVSTLDIFLTSQGLRPRRSSTRRGYQGPSPWLLVRVAVKRSLSQPPAWADARDCGDSGLLHNGPFEYLSSGVLPQSDGKEAWRHTLHVVARKRVAQPIVSGPWSCWELSRAYTAR